MKIEFDVGFVAERRLTRDESPIEELLINNSYIVRYNACHKLKDLSHATAQTRRTQATKINSLICNLNREPKNYILLISYQPSKGGAMVLSYLNLHSLTINTDMSKGRDNLNHSIYKHQCF